MSKILSQEEIDALLNSSVEVEPVQPAAVTVRGPIEAAPGAITYNFRRPDRVSKEQIRSLHFLHDRFARNVGTSLSAYLRAVTDVTIVSVEQFAYSEFLMSLPDPTAFYALSLEPFDALGALELNPAVAFTIVDRMLGGNGQSAPLTRALTEIEQNVVDSVVKLLLENLSEAWKTIVELDFRIQGRETRPQMLQVAAPNEIVILLVFDIRVGESRGMLNLCVPAAVIEGSGANFAQGWQKLHRDPTEHDRKRLYANLCRIPMRLSARLDASLPGRDLVDLRLGDVLSLGEPIARPIDLYAGSRPKFHGRLVRSEERAALAIEAAIGRPRTMASKGAA